MQIDLFRSCIQEASSVPSMVLKATYDTKSHFETKSSGIIIKIELKVYKKHE